jgi:ribonucleoside-diphosphate reductase alpha chain
MTTSGYPDGSLGEIFLKMSKQGSTLAGMMDAFSIAISIGLQYGVPLEQYVKKFVNMRFDPAGLSDDADVRMAQSIMDYIFRRLALDYLPKDKRLALGILTADERVAQLDGDTTDTVEPLDVDAVVEALAQSLPVEAPIAASAAEPVAISIDRASAHSSTELLESIVGLKADAPMCFTCGIKMRPAGSCFVCEGCGTTSGCS